MFGGVGLAACVAVGQLQAPRLKVPLRVLGVLGFYINSLALQDKITPPLPSLAERPGCSGCPPSSKKLRITDVMGLAEEQVLKLFSSIWLLFAQLACLV